MERLPTYSFAFPSSTCGWANSSFTSSSGARRRPLITILGSTSTISKRPTGARELGILERDSFSEDIYELPDGSVQMYLRDPAGNLIEIDWPDVTTIDRSIVTELTSIADERPQSAEAQRASLYPARSPVA